MIVAKETPKACSRCGGEKLRPETDVLDTWFSSGSLALLNPRLAQRNKGTEEILPHFGIGDRVRYSLLLGRTDDDDGS